MDSVKRNCIDRPIGMNSRCVNRRLSASRVDLYVAGNAHAVIYDRRCPNEGSGSAGCADRVRRASNNARDR